MLARGQTGNGANFGLFRGANKACVACGEKGRSCHFRPPFLWFISFGGAKEMNKNVWRAKNEQKNCQTIIITARV
jgi:hypothetical protein